MEDVIVIGISSIVGGAMGAWLYNVWRNWALNRRVTALEGVVERIDNKVRGAKGNEAQAERKVQLLAVAGEAAGMLKEGGELGTVIKTLAAKYPDVAMDLAAKFGFKL